MISSTSCRLGSASGSVSSEAVMRKTLSALSCYLPANLSQTVCRSHPTATAQNGGSFENSSKASYKHHRKQLQSPSHKNYINSNSSKSSTKRPNGTYSLYLRQHHQSRTFSTTPTVPEEKPPATGGADAAAAPITPTDIGIPIAYGGSALKPKEIVEKLDQYIVGQADAKRAVAIALRNRWRRHKLSDELKAEVIPKNILMIGPTGCGKTEIARRIAKLSQAPFIKVEATKFTEVGFHGRDVDQIIRDLLEISITMTKKIKTEMLRGEAHKLVEEKILDILTGANSREDSRETFRTLLRAGALNDRQVDIDVPTGGAGGAGGGWGGQGGGTVFMDGSNPSALNDLLAKFQKMGGKRPSEKKSMTVKEAIPFIEEAELEKMLDNVDITKDAITAVEQSGIVFIDEIDKTISSSDYRGADASAEGVQRDMLPLIEGTTISTKHGNVNTDFILFIASGAFHQCRPSDLLAELQGRLPIRVELQGLTEDDLYHILTEPVTNLLRQQVEMLAAEQVKLAFTDDAIREMARVAAMVNRTVENIGARRLHTVIERIMDTISFDAPDMEAGGEVLVDKALVEQKVNDMLVSSDLSKYIL